MFRSHNIEFVSYNTKIYEIYKNRAKCLVCFDILDESLNNMKFCECGSLAIDGGLSYLKRLYLSKNLYLELSEFRYKKTGKIVLFTNLLDSPEVSNFDEMYENRIFLKNTKFKQIKKKREENKYIVPIIFISSLSILLLNHYYFYT